MGQIRPQARILTIWRIMLTVVMCIPAFLNALFFRAMTTIWMWTTLGWLVIFLLLYLWYFPLRYRKLSFSVTEDYLLLYSGTLYTRVRSMPLRNVQFTALAANPVDQIFGLCSLVVTAAGGRLVLPGLRRQDAKFLAASLCDPKSNSE